MRTKTIPPSNIPPDINRSDQNILIGNNVLFKGVEKTPHFSIQKLETGVILDFQMDNFSSRHVINLGEFSSIKRFTSCHRHEPYWMLPKTGKRGGEVAVETQFILVEMLDHNYVIIVPFCDRFFRSSLQGSGSDEVELVLESGDPGIVTKQAACLYLAAGDDPFKLISEGAKSLSEFMGTGRLRREKMLPAFVDRFGWCTWDAFHHAVSHDLVKEGLESFAAGGILPKFLILDDGWQSVARMPSGEIRLTAFEANEKFPGGLQNTVNMAKHEFGLESFIVWHAVSGYWGGVDGEKLNGYRVRSVARDFSIGMQYYDENINQGWWGSVVGVVPPETVHHFYNDYHRYLRSQGVDGVKVDNQSSLEALGAGWGGRVAMMRTYHEALEGSVQVHFRGALINCMSNGNEVHYQTSNSNLLRTSTDFWPFRPESHGLHIYTNAQVGMWFGEFIHPDWDMFQSGHEMGAFHAMGRAVSGGPVYVSDKPDGHDFELLRKVVLPDGGILRARLPGRPTKDCLFVDPTSEDVLLKVFNRNHDAGIVGIFNARYDPDGLEASVIEGTVSPKDVDGISGDLFAVFRYSTGELRIMDKDELWGISLGQLKSDIFTITPVIDGIAPVGLISYYNSAGAVLAKGFACQDVYQMDVLGGGEFWIYCEREPQKVMIDGRNAAVTYQLENHILSLDLFDVDFAMVFIYF